MGKSYQRQICEAKGDTKDHANGLEFQRYSMRQELMPDLGFVIQITCYPVFLESKFLNIQVSNGGMSGLTGVTGRGLTWNAGRPTKRQLPTPSN